MESNKYKALFDANKELVNLIERRTKLIRLRQETHQNLYNTTTAITKIEIELKEIVMELEKQIPKKIGRDAKDFTEIDKIIKKHYGKVNSAKIGIIAAKKGITINLQQINNRRKALGISPAGIMGRPRKKKKPTEEEDLKLIEEASNINLKDLDGNKGEYKDIETGEEFGEGNPYE